MPRLKTTPRRGLRALGAAAACLLAAPVMAAADVTWTLENAELGDGTYVTGTFTLNTSGYLDAWNLTTAAAGSFVAMSYVPADSYDANNAFYVDFEVDPGYVGDLRITFADDLTVPSSDDPISIGSTSHECQASSACYNLSGGETRYFTGGYATTSPAPEPAAWALMLIGGGAVGGALRRRRVRAIPA